MLKNIVILACLGSFVNQLVATEEVPAQSVELVEEVAVVPEPSEKTIETAQVVSSLMSLNNKPFTLRLLADLQVDQTINTIYSGMIEGGGRLLYKIGFGPSQLNWRFPKF